MFPFSLFACSSGKQAVFLAQPLWRMKGPLAQYLRRSKNSVRNEDKLLQSIPTDAVELRRFRSVQT
jgi:hypothetical protein